MVLTIRKATKEDEPFVSRICLLTGDAGNSAEHLHDYPELPGLVYAVPYVQFPTTWGFVLVDEDIGEPVGYVLGSTDTRAYEAYAAEYWWPTLAEKYPPSIATKPGDVQYTKLIRNMYSASKTCVDFSPAHLHIDILAAYQKQGWGKTLIRQAIDYLKEEEGQDKVWLEMDPRNEGAKVFYSKLGFKEIEGGQPTQMGLRYDEFRG
ncbi:acyl-CoA N-acyltransferase [Coprinopsis sp. MPI-PUGE-AT-0042]|nr:acyl-CoA N-acyltransferase [Coprinopsis sp. MPI-PUGE-AT-0042]